MQMDIDLTSTEIINDLLNLRLCPFDVDKIAKQIDADFFIFFEPIDANKDIRIRKVLYFIDKKIQYKRQLFILFGNYKDDLFDLLCICERCEKGIFYYDSLDERSPSVDFKTLCEPDELIIEKLYIFTKHFVNERQTDLIVDVFDLTIDDEEFKNKMRLNIL